MAKKSNLVTMVLSVVLVLGLVYYFRPQMFNFLLKQGFSTSSDPDEFNPEGESDGFNNPDDERPLSEGFFACEEGKDTETGEPC